MPDDHALTPQDAPVRARAKDKATPLSAKTPACPQLDLVLSANPRLRSGEVQ
ncbi:hypothetical protein [Marivita sp.]|uniref:hypothetical protein n=1 Tax=Marivita sp. TaxID=2003365 RepID=UPI0025C5E062|nr:hypothetical protein [Marivita sp.]